MLGKSNRHYHTNYWLISGSKWSAGEEEGDGVREEEEEEEEEANVGSEILDQEMG